SSVASNARQAADALESGNTQQAAQSLKNLANAVDDASKSITSQSDLGQALDDVRTQMGRGAPTNDPDLAGQDGTSGETDLDLARMLDQGAGATSAQTGDPSGAPGEENTSQPTGEQTGSASSLAGTEGTGGSSGGNGPGSAT